MKLNELKTMGSKELRIYNCLFRLVSFGIGNRKGFYYDNKRSLRELADEVDELEVTDIFDMYEDEQMLKIRGFGEKSLSRLKELA